METSLDKATLEALDFESPEPKCEVDADVSLCKGENKADYWIILHCGAGKYFCAACLEDKLSASIIFCRVCGHQTYSPYNALHYQRIERL